MPDSALLPTGVKSKSPERALPRYLRPLRSSPAATAMALIRVFASWYLVGRNRANLVCRLCHDPDGNEVQLVKDESDGGHGHGHEEEEGDHGNEGQNCHFHAGVE